ncbi:hypothetical protein QBC34DRAFT_407476 [Podospora aff. communis PSN243]|uniref:PQ loop repeat protein n=1 Tax=Podospora aff. communis PSN243 TaxID=3040156 RepID=A0AAV9GLA0_9PEZI|nr:hypothetical protein QBC34DRAFT_407476 [Podospora aff. communis PSN243]
METLAQEDLCEDLRDINVVNLIVSISIVIGMLISYLPQHVRIIKRGTSEGISPYFILLGTTSATSAFGNILLLPQSRRDVACCKELETFHCVAGLLGITQLGIQWICFTFIFVLFLVFFRYNPENDPDNEELGEGGDSPRWQTALLVAVLTLLHGLAVIVITGILTTVAPEELGIWANTLGIMAALLAAVQYLPQIWMTYHIKHVGSLSIPMMCMQTPGGFIFAGSLFARLGWAGWSSWGIFVLTASMQGILLAMAIYYETVAHNQAGKPLHRGHRSTGNNTIAENPDEERQENEADPLLRNGSSRNYTT